MENLPIISEKVKLFLQNNFVLSLIIIFISIFVFFIIGLSLGRLIEKLKTSKRIKEERTDALKKSRAILRGQLYEQLAPYFPNFPVNPQSLKFLGSPIDYVAFIASEEDPENIHEIIFIEIKTGDSSLTNSEKSIKTAIAKNKVRFIEYYI